MKLLFNISYNYKLVFFLLVLNTSIYSQQIDTLSKSVLQQTKILKKDSLINTAIVDSLNHILISEKWDTKRFNPYKNQSKKFPFEIEFSDSTYASPIERKKVVTSRYGWRKGRPHKGIDLDLVTGDNVMAMFEGIVRFARYSSGHGKTVIIRHYNGLETAYAHLSKYIVKANDTVQKGQIIGKGGTTGNARGSHLHLIASYKGNYINPEYLFDFAKDNLIRKQNLWITKHWVSAHFHSSKKQSNLFFYTNHEEALASQKKQNKRQIHIVKRGDTLSEISNKYRISLASLCKTNAISKNGVLKIGKKLIIH